MRIAAGFLISMMLMCGAAQAASFDCAAAATPDEHAICEHPELSSLDDRLPVAFAKAKEASSDEDEVRQIARDFLAARHECHRDVSCIRNAYTDVLDSFRAASDDGEVDESDDAETEDTPPGHASPSVCVVILGLMREAVLEGRASGDEGVLRSGSKTFRRKADALNEGNAQQMIGSTVAFYDGLTPKQLSRATDLCLSAVDEDFTEDN
jgi:uncharacterized protein